MKKIRIVLVFALLGGCTGKTVAPLPAPSPTPTTPPTLSQGVRAHRVPGGVEYHVVVRSESGTVYLPVELVPLDPPGQGKSSWFIESAAPFAYDPASDRYVSRDEKQGGAKQPIYVDVVFPGSPQEMSIVVKYGSAPIPASQSFTLRYRSIEVPDLAQRIYVLPEITDAEGSRKSTGDRSPLGDRLHDGPKLSRWFTSGFFLKDPGETSEATVTVQGAE